MAKVTPAIPAIGLPWKSVVLPLKFTRRGTGADDCVDAPCWAATREQNIEIVRSMESENLQDFMAHLNSSRFFRSHARSLVCPGRRINPFDLSALLRDIWLFEPDM